MLITKALMRRRKGINSKISMETPERMTSIILPIRKYKHD